jgi:HSP20 family protein
MVIRFSDQPVFNPWLEFERLRREMDRIINGRLDAPSRFSRTNVFPALNISEDKDNLYVRAELPGIKAAQIELAVEGETLTIKGERKPYSPDSPANKFSYHRRELEYGNFSRAVTLPTKIVPDKVNAKAENGILTIILPKAEEVKPRQITVKVD